MKETQTNFVTKGKNKNKGPIGYLYATLQPLVEKGDLQELYKKIIDNHVHINDSIGYDRSTLLHLAVKYKQSAIIEYLLNQGASVCVDNKEGEIPIHWAVKNKQTNIVDRLLQQGRRLDQIQWKNRKDENPLYLAAKNENAELVNIFFQNISEYSWFTAENCELYRLAEKGNCHEMRDAIYTYVGLMAIARGGGYFNQWILKTGVRMNDLVFVDKALQKKGCDIRFLEQCDYAEAARNGHIDMLYQLLQEKAPREWLTAYKKLPLLKEAVSGTFIPIRNALKEHCHALAESLSMGTVVLDVFLLRLAQMYKDQAFLQNTRLKETTIEKWNEDAYIMAARDGNLSIIQLLINYRVSTPSLTEKNKKFLALAVSDPSSKIYMELKNNGANLASKMFISEKALFGYLLQLGLNVGDVHFTQKLIQADTALNRISDRVKLSILYAAAKGNNTDVIAWLFTKETDSGKNAEHACDAFASILKKDEVSYDLKKDEVSYETLEYLLNEYGVQKAHQAEQNVNLLENSASSVFLFNR